MKKQLVSFSLMTTAALAAQQPGDCDLCEPCCVPQPKKCINCECYVPQFYDLQCDCGFFVDGEFLYWYANEIPFPIGMEITTGDLSDTVILSLPKKNYTLNAEWDPGFRVGVGWNSECDGWDLYLNWTYMHNSNSRRVTTVLEGSLPTAGETALLSPWVYDFTPTIPAVFDEIRAKWLLNYNVIDLELGRKYWLSHCFNLRPYTGLRGGWTRVRLNLNNSHDDPTGADLELYKERFKNNWWGVGFSIGLQPTWYFSSCFALYGQGGYSLLWGKYDGVRRESIFNVSFSDSTLSYSTVHEYFGMQSIFDLGIGLRYEDTYCCDRYRFTLDLGWEHHILTNHVGRARLAGPFVNNSAVNGEATNGFRNVICVHTDLGLGGLVVRVRFDF